MSLGWIHDRRFLLHRPGGSHVECPERLDAIHAALEESGLADQLQAIPFRHASAEQLALVHEPAYVALVRLACEQGFPYIGSPDTGICAWSYDVAALATGGVLAACEAVSRGEVRRAFCAVRPPGHHAEADRAMGFCLFNHVALAAEHLIRNRGFSRVAIVDFDVHHGNGTQQIFEERRDVLYVSLHEHPDTLGFPGSGRAEERGRGCGAGFTRNVPLRQGSGESEYLNAIRNEVVPALDDFRPAFVLLSAGFDGLEGDRIAHHCLRPASYQAITTPLVATAERHSGGRLVSVLEGGYDLPNLGAAVTAHVRALLSDPRAE